MTWKTVWQVVRYIGAYRFVLYEADDEETCYRWAIDKDVYDDDVQIVEKEVQRG